MLLDLSGLTREERVMAQASISNEHDFDRVADALIMQHPRIHLRESQRRTKGSNVETIQTLIGSVEMARTNTLAAEKLEQVHFT